VLALGLAACGGGTDVDDGASDTTTGNTSGNQDACEGVTLEASEVGVTPDTITITVTADTGSPIRPGLFQGSIDAVTAWAEAQNAQGGLACRQVEVKVADSKLNADESRNALAAACGDSFALVGTTALFLNDMTPAESCKDKAGATTGLPDLAVLQTEAVQQCSAISFAMLPTAASCPYSGEGERTYPIATTAPNYYFDQYGDDLHGVYVIARDLPSTITASMALFRGAQQLGIKSDGEFGISGLAVQSDYTPVVVAMKNAGSNFAQVGLDYKGTVYLRKEAAAQGIDASKVVWHCTTQCYDPRLISEGGDAVEGQWTWIAILPLEDKGANETLDAYIDAVEKPDSFGQQAWMAAELFKQVVNEIVEADGPNGLTRAALLEGVRNTHDFDAGGMAPKTDVGGKKAQPCLIGMQVQDGKFVRMVPKEKGEFECATGEPESITFDAQAAFQG
jgi:ABC-type branched-subunit amino acid transport system substrate-binding protein